jgi:hypothetical protein
MFNSCVIKFDVASEANKCQFIQALEYVCIGLMFHLHRHDLLFISFDNRTHRLYLDGFIRVVNIIKGCHFELLK